MATLQDYINQVQLLVHDTNGADFSVATLTSFINQARQRVALDTHCVRGFMGVTSGNALNTIPQQENYLYSGSIGGITVTNAGSGYTAPTISFTGGGGTGAAAQAVLDSSGTITAIQMTNWGLGYTSAPQVVINDATGTSATATATPLLNVLDILSLTVLWGNQRIVFGWQPFTMFQAICRQYVNQYSVPSVFTMHQGIKQFFMFQIPDQAYTMEMDYVTMASPLVNTTDIDTQIVDPFTDAVQLYAAHLCLASLQNHTMADYWYSGDMNKPGKYDLRLKQLFSTSVVRRIYNPYYTFLPRARMM
jgi:hypothetical protein